MNDGLLIKSNILLRKKRLERRVVFQHPDFPILHECRFCHHHWLRVREPDELSINLQVSSMLFIIRIFPEVKSEGSLVLCDSAPEPTNCLLQCNASTRTETHDLYFSIRKRRLCSLPNISLKYFLAIFPNSWGTSRIAVNIQEQNIEESFLNGLWIIHHTGLDHTAFFLFNSALENASARLLMFFILFCLRTCPERFNQFIDCLGFCHTLDQSQTPINC